jgi:ribosomal protein S18 acetylase RimI-like enzyme
MAIIRPAASADIPRLLELYDELVLVRSEIEESRAPSPGEYRRTLERIQATPGYQLLVIEECGEVAGVMEFLIMPNLSHNASPWALIEGLVIDSRYRRKGLGKALVGHAINMSGEAGCFTIGLSSNKMRVEAHAFYRSLGFEDAALGFRLYF